MTAKHDEEVFPADDPYSWTDSSDKPIEDFLSKYKPSMVENDGTKPWLWIRVKKEAFPSGTGSPSDGKRVEALVKASLLLQEATVKVEAIKNDASIPARSNKKTGAKSKKEVREEIQKEYTAKFKDVSLEYGWTCGKWLLFAPADKVDGIWSRLAKSIYDGPLSSTPITVAKVATSPANQAPNYQHVICLYLPNVYDKVSVEETMRILLRNHGSNLSGVKSDLYTLIGIDSKHPSGIQSTIWRNNDIMKETEIKELKDAFYAEGPTGKGDSKPTASKSVKPKAVTKDPFASDNEEGEEAPKPKIKPKPKAKASRPDPFASDGENNESEVKKDKAKKAPGKRARAAEDGDDEEEAKPKKKSTA